MKAALSKSVDSALTDTNVATRSNAVRILDNLTVKLASSQKTGIAKPFDLTSSDSFAVVSAHFFRDEIVTFSLPHLLKVALVEIGGNSTSELRIDAKDLIRSHISNLGRTGNRKDRSSFLRDSQIPIQGPYFQMLSATHYGQRYHH